MSVVHDYDSAWKNILTYMEREVIEVLFPDIYPQIEWKYKAKSLDKELQELKRKYHDKREGHNVTSDKILEVRLKSGEIKILFIHLEVQSSNKNEKPFAKRMFQYYYRIKDMQEYTSKEPAQVVAAAIYTYPGKAGKESRYEEYLLDTDFKIVEYRFKTIDIETFNLNKVNDDNPIKMVFKIAKEHLNYLRKGQQDICNAKIRLAYELDNYINLSIECKQALTDFLDYLFLLDDKKLIVRFKNEIEKSKGVYNSMTIKDVREAHYKREERIKTIITLLRKGLSKEEVKDLLGYTDEEIDYAKSHMSEV